jgi:hypothetical protein
MKSAMQGTMIVVLKLVTQKNYLLKEFFKSVLTNRSKFPFRGRGY